MGLTDRQAADLRKEDAVSKASQTLTRHTHSNRQQSGLGFHNGLTEAVRELRKDLVEIYAELDGAGEEPLRAELVKVIGDRLSAFIQSSVAGVRGFHALAAAREGEQLKAVSTMGIGRDLDLAVHARTKRKAPSAAPAPPAAPARLKQDKFGILDSPKQYDVDFKPSVGLLEHLDNIGMDIQDMEKKPIAEKVAQLRLAPDAADAPHAPRGLPSSDDDLARLILDIVADAEVETGAPVSLIAVRSSLVTPPLGEEKRRRIDAALRRLVPRLLEEDGNMSNPSFGLSLDGWLRSHRAAAVEKAIDDFLRLYHKKVAGPDPEFRSTSWDEVRAEAGVQDDLFHLYVIISGKAGLWSGGSHTSGRIQPGTKPTAQFNRPTDIANLVELTDAAQLLAYRQRRMAEIEIAYGPLPQDIREVLAAVYEHVLANGDWPLTQNLNIELRNRGLRLEALAGKQRGLLSGVDAFQEGARTHLSLKGMVLVEKAESDVAWIIKIVRKLGEHHATNPQRRDVPVLEVANEIGLSDHAVLARLVRVLGVQGSPFLVLGGPGYPVDKATFGTNAYFLDFREVESPLDLIRTVERAYDPGWGDEKAKADSEDDMLEQDEEDQSADSFSSGYELVEKVNIGAFADVWRAKDPFGRTVAAKIVRSSMAEQSSALEHAKALARAEHPNVVRLYTIARIEDPETRSPVDAIIMEFLEGEDLEERFGRAFTRAEVRQYGQELIEGVEHIHAQHLAHGDLHEGNVMVTARGLKVIDILYMDTLALLSTASREQRLRVDLRRTRDMLTSMLEKCVEISPEAAAVFERGSRGNLSFEALRSALMDALALE